MNTTSIGQQAEAAASSYVQALGYHVLERNWRTKWCEIDIVASKGRIIYFIEVKYRHQATQGTGLEYITTKKLHQMRLAAALWVAKHRWQGDYGLSALGVSGPYFAVTAFEADLL
ncbi:YraN family protein [Candidatus Saccharibacteria bacterium]|nr:YraN family protein [Candidatus Saccharibacteria bacterium]